MPRLEPTRRRFIAIAAAVAATAAWPRIGAANATLYEWRGVALGAAATIRLVHPDAEAARRLLDRCATEIVRLERIFSLYRADSALCRLNAAGALDAPPFELVELLGRAAAASAATDGAFDVTVQPLWQLYAGHFATADADSAGPAIDDVLPLVDWRGISVGIDRIALARPGMAVTLNGIAQGYITDRVADLLRAEGMDHVLVDLGETRAIGAHPDGRPWQIGLADPVDPARIAERVDLADLALATSGGYGTRFEASGRFNHLIDPRTGRSAPALRSVSVLAPTATTADSASTALSLLPPADIGPALRRLGATAAYVCDAGGATLVTA